MRRATAFLAVLVAAAGLLAAVTGSPAASTPRLKLIAASPMTVRGSGFVAHEHVRLRLRERDHALTTRTVTASSTGSFTATFPAARPGRCEGFSLAATGSRGSRTSMPRPFQLPACRSVRAPLDRGRPPLG